LDEQQEHQPSDLPSSFPVYSPNDRLLDQDMTEECQKKMAEVDSAFDNAVANMTDAISGQCFNTLNSPRHHVCMDFLLNNANDQVESLVVIDAKFAKVKITNSVYFGNGCSAELKIKSQGSLRLTLLTASQSVTKAVHLVMMYCIF
jgi:hypothetical protein